jgi:hypothetical protein
MVVALIALVAAMGGTSWALAKHSVGKDQLKKGAVTSAAVKDGSLQKRDLSKAALTGPGLLGRGRPVAFRLAPTSPVTSTAVFNSDLPAGRRFLLSDIVVQNPAEDIGRVRIRRGGVTLLELGMQNFTTHEQHFDTPIRFGAGQRVSFFVDCDNPSGGCTPAALFVGVVTG